MLVNFQSDEFNDHQFQNPPAKFRGAPFWAWNCVIKDEYLEKQIGYFQEMGMGGFHIHCRTGMATPYLGDEFMHYVKKCNQIAKEKNMLCWLYDEDRYASGYGGGFVTKDIVNRERYLIFSPNKPESDYLPSKAAFDEAVSKGFTPKGYYVAAYRIQLDNEYLSHYVRLSDNDIKEDDNEIWWAYVKISDTSTWWNNQTYVNTLDKKAIDRFIDVTYEIYYEEVGDDFGKSIPAIFTDEPQYARKEHLNFASEKRKITIPFTDDFTETFNNKYGSDILESLPELVWELPNQQISVIRYQYHNHLADRFVHAYAKNIGDWCEKHNIALSGHMKGEETLYSQTLYVGEVMRSLRHFHIPGHDVLCDQRDYVTAKLAQSVAHQYGRIGAMSELYGVTNWDFDFKGHKMSGDWQAALGITVRVHHLSWMSMEGEAKRDYPASINYQSPWYKKYNIIEDHFARLNTALTSGKPTVRIGVIHPIESFWLHFGPYEQTYLQQNELENNYQNIAEWLLFNQLDYDFISEALLEEQVDVAEKDNLSVDEVPCFKMEEMRYEIVIIPGCHTLRSHTVKKLTDFVKSGGKVIFLGDIPYAVDGMSSNEVKQLAKQCDCIPFEKNHLLHQLEEVREIDVRFDSGERANNIVYQMRENGNNRWLFLAHAYERIRDTFDNMVNSVDYQYTEKIMIRINGLWHLTEYNTLNGNKSKLQTNYKNNHTILIYDLSVHDSLLLLLEPIVENKESNPEHVHTYLDLGTSMAGNRTEYLRMPQPMSVTFDEPNVFLLDNAEYCLDNEEWNPVEDILKLDNINRIRLGFPPKEEAGAQPWTNNLQEIKSHVLSLRFHIDSDIDIDTELALESLNDTTIYVNGVKIESPIITGWYVDESIQRIKIPTLKKGRNEIIFKIPYGKTSNIEACYLLGDFGVSVLGAYKKIIEKPDKVVFGDLTKQGYPFYSGNLTYHFWIETPKADMKIKIQHFNNPLLSVVLDGKEIGDIIFAPYSIDLGHVSEGYHDLKIVTYGNRFNTFGQLHNSDKNYTWHGSCSWRTTGDRWSDEYQLKENGILSTPMLFENSN